MSTDGLRTMDVKRLTGQAFLHLSMPCVWRLPARKRQQRFVIGVQAEGQPPVLARPVTLYVNPHEAAQAAIAYSMTR